MPYVTESNITDVVLERWKAVPDPRLLQIMQSMIKHLHAFIRDIEPTEQEWMSAVEWLTRTGKLSTEKRQEFILASDVVGVSMLVDCINHRLADEATPSTVTGPFHVHGSPQFANGADVATGAPGELCYIAGSVRSLDGRPIAGASLDIWQADGEGFYDAQRGSDEPWMRGIFTSGADGSFVVQTVLPVPYSIPMDGSVGELMARMRTALRHRMLRKSETPLLRVGGVEIDAVRHRVTRAGAEIKLTPKEFELLSFLARHAGRVLTHKQILTAVWGPAHTEDTQYLRVYVGQLRQKIEDKPDDPQIVLTEPGIGYRVADA